MTSTTTATANHLINAIDWSVLGPAALALLATVVGSLISKEDGFNTRVSELLEKLLQKKIAALRFLLDSIEFTPTSFGEVKDFKGRRFFIEVEKYGALEHKTRLYSYVYRFIMSAFHYELVVALLIMGGSFLSSPLIDGYATFVATTLLVLTIIEIIVIRLVEGAVNKLVGMEELRHME